MRRPTRSASNQDARSGAEVVPFRDEFQPAFEWRNREWIEAHFTVEPADRELLGDPRGKIVAAGGEVFFVLDRGQVQGACAVIRHSAHECEIAKMTVAPAARGLGFGDLLMEASIAFARRIDAERISIVSNTVLAPALRLYRKYGFHEVPLARDPRYQRVNLRLELTL
jgi:putative acetyltransferase